MTFPSNADADPDPTTQMTWPSSRRSGSSSHIFKSNYPGGHVESPQVERGPLNAGNAKALANAGRKKRLSTKDLIFLSISMAGAQIAWTVELGYVYHCLFIMSFLVVGVSPYHRTLTDFMGRYGTPFLLTLGLSEQLTSLVWLAGPISGLIAQPLIGASIRYAPSLFVIFSPPSFRAQWQNFILSHNQPNYSASPLPRLQFTECSQSSFILTRFLYFIMTH